MPCWLATHLSFGVHLAPATAIPILRSLKDVFVALGGYQAPIPKAGLQGKGKTVLLKLPAVASAALKGTFVSTSYVNRPGRIEEPAHLGIFPVLRAPSLDLLAFAGWPLTHCLQMKPAVS